MVRHGVEQGSALTGRVAPVVALVAVVYAVLVPLRIQQHGVRWFIHVGSLFLDSSRSSPAIDSIGPAQSRVGYDGQFYFMIAADPARAHDYMSAGSEGPQAGKRYGRIGYPLVARALSLGSVRALPWAMLAVNLAAVLGGVWAVGLWLRRRGRSPWFAALYGLWPGIVFSVFRDLTEPLAYFLVAAALLVFDVRGRGLRAAAVLLAGALLTRETTIAFPFALAVGLAVHDRTWRRATAFLAGTLAPMLVWRVAVGVWLATTTLDRTNGWKVLAPLYGMYSWWPWDGMHWLIALTIDLPLLPAAAGALVVLRRRKTPVALPLLLLLDVALFVVFIPHFAVTDYGSAGRNAAPALLAALYCVPLVRNRTALAAGAWMLSPVWFALVAWLAAGSSAVGLVTQ